MHLKASVELRDLTSKPKSKTVLSQEPSLERSDNLSSEVPLFHPNIFSSCLPLPLHLIQYGSANLPLRDQPLELEFTLTSRVLGLIVRHGPHANILLLLPTVVTLRVTLPLYLVPYSPTNSPLGDEIINFILLVFLIQSKWPFRVRFPIAVHQWGFIGEMFVAGCVIQTSFRASTSCDQMG